MGYILNRDSFHEAVDKLREEYLVYAPTLKKGEGTFSEIDVVRYDEIGSAEELELSLRSDYSFKEVLLPLSQTLFYFTEDEVTEAKLEEEKFSYFFEVVMYTASSGLMKSICTTGYPTTTMTKSVKMLSLL